MLAASGRVPALITSLREQLRRPALDPRLNRVPEGLHLLRVCGALHGGWRGPLHAEGRVSDPSQSLLARDPHEKPATGSSLGQTGRGGCRTPRARDRNPRSATIACDEYRSHHPRRIGDGLIGPNGAGKTTTFSMLAGYLSRPFARMCRCSGTSRPTPTRCARASGSSRRTRSSPRATRSASSWCTRRGSRTSARARAEGLRGEVLAGGDGKDWWGCAAGRSRTGWPSGSRLRRRSWVSRRSCSSTSRPRLDPRVAYEVRDISSAREKGAARSSSP